MSVIETTSQRPEWEIANDARILREAMDIQQDPTRLREAKNYIQSEIDINNKVLGKNRNSKHNNPATIAKLTR